MVPRALEEHHRDGAIEMITLMLLLCDAIIYPHFWTPMTNCFLVFTQCYACSSATFTYKRSTFL